MKTNFLKIIILLISLLAFNFSRSAFAQSDSLSNSVSKNLENAVEKLQLKLLLTNDQKATILKIIKEHITKSLSVTVKENVLKAVNDKVVIYLTKKQVTKFSILKNNWLDEILESVEENNIKTE